jgi:L-seryl-tRNA(Ser) seleniumtransferase
MRLRDLPSVDELARDARLAGEPRALAVEAARAALARAREEIKAGHDPGDLAERALAELDAARAPSLRRTLNATGVVVHTNLGRAPLAEAALARALEVGRGYSNLEYDLAAGRRGSRQDHVAGILRRLTGAEAALVVNNNAAAVMLTLAALAEGREVLVSRGELIEIGDGFRIPDVLARSGASLCEVGTTNRTRAADYERAIGPETALLLRVHQSNFRVVGFTEQPSLEELAATARRHGLPLVDDLGSGVLVQLEGEPSAKESLAAGADLVSFSGDKLLGGPQAGIVVGRAELVERLRRHPLQRALRADKLTLAALEGTLGLYLDPARALVDVPVLRMLNEPLEVVRARAERLAAAVGGEVEETVCRVGGGALPLAELPSFACAVEEELAGPLRRGDPPIVGVVRDGRLLLDCRTLTDAEAEEAVACVEGARGREPARLAQSTSVHALDDPGARSDLCRSVLEALPEWFGIAESVEQYVREVAELPTFVVGGEAFLSLKLHNEATAEIYVMGVRPESQGRGAGTALVRAAEAFLQARGVEYLQVKTLGASRPSAHYARTRRFYESRGFRPLEELTGIWNESNPCLIMVKHLDKVGG